MEKNVEISNYLIMLLQRTSGEAFFSEADLKRLTNKKIEKTVLANGIIRLAVVEAKEPT